MDAPDAPDNDREKLILDRILSLKQMMKDGQGGPIDLHELGICYYYLNNFSQAVSYLEQLIESYPDYVEIGTVYALQIYCLIQAEDFARSEELIKKRLQVHQTDTRLTAMLAFVYEKLGRPENSIETHRRVLELDPDNLNSLNSIGYLLTIYGEDSDQEEALRFLTRAVRARPDHPAYLDSLGVLLAQRGDQERAKKALYRALKSAPDNAEILEHIQTMIKSVESQSSARETDSKSTEV